MNSICYFIFLFHTLWLSSIGYYKKMLRLDMKQIFRLYFSYNFLLCKNAIRNCSLRKFIKIVPIERFVQWFNILINFFYFRNCSYSIHALYQFRISGIELTVQSFGFQNFGKKKSFFHFVSIKLLSFCCFWAHYPKREREQ